jgi:hypothetical protein
MVAPAWATGPTRTAAGVDTATLLRVTTTAASADGATKFHPAANPIHTSALRDSLPTMGHSFPKKAFERASPAAQPRRDW